MNRFVKKMILLLLCAAVLTSFCACKDRQSDDTPQPQPTKAQVDASEVFRLPYDYTDTLSAYQINSSTNQYLVPLVYDGLFYADLSGEMKNRLAESYSENYSTIAVTLRDDAFFSDGSSVSANDVVYSFECAKDSEQYSQSLAKFESASAKDDKTVIFYLSSNHSGCLNMLDFPIVKQSDPNIGSGRYYLASSAKGDPVLLYNKYSLYEETPDITSIYLVNCSDTSAILDMYNADSLDMFYDSLSIGSKKSAQGSSSPCYLNNLIYIGLNCKNKYLGDTNFTSGISCAINQTELTGSAYLGLGTPTSTPYPADKYDMGTVIVNSVTGDIESAKSFFKEAGYSYNSLGIKLLDGKKQVSLTLLISSDNQLKSALAEEIKVELANAGIAVKIKAVGTDEFISTVKNEKFDMYIGEVKLSDDYNMDCFFAGGDTSYGIDSESNTCTAYKRYDSGDSTLQNFISNFCEECPFIPLMYRHGLVYHSSRVTGDFTCNESDLFYNILEWKYTDEKTD